VKEVQYYLNGDQHGGDTLWYEDGKIQFTVFFQHNKKDGYLRKWAPDGSLVFESKYARDTLIEVKGEPISRSAIEARHASDTIIKPSRQQ
jgi:antitoxin component YwqK of YwqJK toxin-antitoxin module